MKLHEAGGGRGTDNNELSPFFQHEKLFRTANSKKIQTIGCCLLLLAIPLFCWNNVRSDTIEYAEEGTKRRIKEDSNSHAIFYTAYVPPQHPDRRHAAYDILKDHVEQIGASDVARLSSGKIPFNYVTIGHESAVDWINLLCSYQENLLCHHLGHHKSGYEMIAQQHLLKYCIANTDHTVSYVHSKGTLNPSPGKNKSRKDHTRHALDKRCTIDLPQNQCNVCGNNFYAVWGPMYWGTFFSSKCEYVQNLISPFKVEEMYREAFAAKPKGMNAQLYQDLGTEKEIPFGGGRFAAEIFIGTHPNLVPCSFVRGTETFWSVDPPEAFPYAAIPQANFYESFTNLMDHRGVAANHTHLHEWFFLPGLLWRYHYFYKEMPPSDSWIWRHFFHGKEWKERVELKGYPDAYFDMIKDI